MPPVTPTPEGPRRALRVRHFAIGLLLTSSGVAILLLVALGAIQQSGMAVGLPLLVVAIFAIIGIMLLGGGFGLMATATPGLDDGEFNRLMHAGDPQPSRFDETAALKNVETFGFASDETPGDVANNAEFADGEFPESIDSKDWTDKPIGSGREQGNSDEVQEDAVTSHLAGRQSA